MCFTLLYSVFKRCVFSIRQIRNGEQKSYVLKNKELTGPTKGVIYLEIDVIYNTVSVSVSVHLHMCFSFLFYFTPLSTSTPPHLGSTTSFKYVFLSQVKAALRTVVPAEQKYIEEEPKVSKQV